MPYPFLIRGLNLTAALIELNKEEIHNFTEIEIRLLTCLSYSPLNVAALVKFYQSLIGIKLHYSRVHEYLSPLIESGYIIKQGKTFLITPSGLLILSRLEKRLKRIR